MFIYKKQKRTSLLFELLDLVVDSCFLVMTADMEMDPRDIRDFIEMAKKTPEKIICALKWDKGSIVEGYGKFHKLGSRLMNAFVASFFRAEATDPFSVYQIYPISVYRRMYFRRPGCFLYEYTLKPLRLGVQYEEIKRYIKSVVNENHWLISFYV